MKATELVALLRDFYKDKLSMRQRHVAVAKHVPDYDFNNTYQYIIAREDVQLNWLRDAITDMGGALDDVSEPEVSSAGKGTEAQSRLIGEDRDGAQRFVDTWRPRVESMPNARHSSAYCVMAAGSFGEMITKSAGPIVRNDSSAACAMAPA